MILTGLLLIGTKATHNSGRGFAFSLTDGICESEVKRLDSVNRGARGSSVSVAHFSWIE
jgi:hypothetical protein